MGDMRISAIVAIDNKRGMGKDGGIPWHIPGEQKRFKDITTPHPMIMGRKTFESIGRVLPNRLHIIISRDPSHNLSGQETNCLFVTSLDQAMTLAKEEETNRLKSVILSETKDLDSSPLAQNDKEGEIFVIGGGQILKEAMPLLDRLYLTIIEKDFACDTFFPDYSGFTKVIEKEDHGDNDPPYTFLTLER